MVKSKLAKMDKYTNKLFAKIKRRKMLSEQIKDIERQRQTYYYRIKKDKYLKGRIGSGKHFAEQLRDLRKQKRRIK